MIAEIAATSIEPPNAKKITGQLAQRRRLGARYAQTRIALAPWALRSLESPHPT